MDAARPNRELAYFVILRDALIAQDLAQIVREFDSDAHVIIAPTAERALDMLPSDMRIALVFLELSVKVTRTFDSAERIFARGGKIVLTGPGAEAGTNDFAAEVLEMPFLPHSVFALLSRLT